MKNKEVIEVLQGLESWGGCSVHIGDIYMEAIEQAIKCVELMPELSEMLNKAMQLANGCEGVGFSWDKAYKLLDKTKELIK